MARSGAASSGMAEYGRYVWAWLCGAVLGWVVLGMVRQAWLVLVRYGKDRRGVDWHGRRGKDRLGAFGTGMAS